MKYYVCSDIHGFYTLLKKTLRETGFENDASPHKLILVGDCFDRGEEAAEMQGFILNQMEQEQLILVRGNHEDLFEEFATVDNGLPYEHHLFNGTFDTALQLTGFSAVKADEQPSALAAACRETPYFRKIIPAAVDWYETEHYIFTHGWIPCNRKFDGTPFYDSTWREADAEEWREARWQNGMYSARFVTEPQKTIVCGHYHTSYGHSHIEKIGSEFGADADFSPYYGKGIIAIDACTAFSGKINCVILED